MSSRLYAVMPGADLQVVEGFAEMAAIYDRLPDQRPSTCGVYPLQFILPAADPRLNRDEETPEDYLAYLAGTVLEPSEDAASRAIQQQVDAGALDPENARQDHGTVWYRHSMAVSDDPSATGTSPRGVARAVRIASNNRLTTIPFPSRLPTGKVQLTPARWQRLLDVIAMPAASTPLYAIVNYQSDLLLKPNSRQYHFEALNQPGMFRTMPRDDWGVGHFAALAGFWAHPDGTRWPILFDTYKERGLEGYQPQPSELLRQAIIREDGRGGGVLLITGVATAARTSSVLSDIGLKSGFWDNGSPDPPDDGRS